MLKFGLISFLILFFSLFNLFSENINYDEEIVLKIKFKMPARSSIKEFIKISGKNVYQSKKQNFYFVKLTLAELTEIFGVSFSKRIVRGAGNKRFTDDVIYKVIIKNGFKENIRKFIKNIIIENDSKFDLTADYKEIIP